MQSVIVGDCSRVRCSRRSAASTQQQPTKSMPKTNTAQPPFNAQRGRRSTPLPTLALRMENAVRPGPRVGGGERGEVAGDPFGDGPPAEEWLESASEGEGVVMVEERSIFGHRRMRAMCMGFSKTKPTEVSSTQLHID